MNKKVKEITELTIHDALANLSTIADMTIDLNEPIGIVKKHKIVIQNEDFGYRTIDWFIPETADDLIENVLQTYVTLYEYLKNIYEKDFIDWGDEKCKKGLKAVMVMASEAANKIDEYIELLPKQPGIIKIVDSEVYKQLQSFYLKNIGKRFSEELEGDESWKDSWHENEKSFLLDIEKSGLKDFETLKNDTEYELFNMVDDNDKPFFDDELIRNIKLFCSYDEEGLKKIEDDPLLKVRVFIDRDYQISSENILKNVFSHITKFYSEKIYKEKESEIVSLINKATYALMLAANPKNLIQNSFLKNCIDYFHDFLNFLRQALSSDEYQRIIAYSLDDKKSQIIKELLHGLSKSLFTRHVNIKQELIGFIHLLIRKGEEKRKFTYPKNASFFNILLENDESIKTALNNYPSGPLMKLLDVVREEDIVGFDPIMQDNVPSKLYEFSYNAHKNIEILKVPSPTYQFIVSAPKITEEFKSFIRNYKNEEKYLFINLQDNTSFNQYPRCNVIDDLKKRADFKDNIVIVRIDKHTDFYHQTGAFLNINNSENFFKEFKNELYQENGSFSFFKSAELSKFIDNALQFIHKQFFTEKNVLTRKNRLDFIEIFYNMLILKVIEIIEPKALSFSCKDALDIGAAMSASFFAFVHLIKNEQITKQMEDFIRYLFYSPSLLVRERAINSIALTRAVSSLNTIDMEMLTKSNKILKGLSSLYDPSFLKSIKII
ncbi:MAG: hypothetical protein JXA94_05005 [Parachlamydiales bacterium]|nr:hypothetical protein [Parachlamydiales bacterium]